MNIVDRIQGDCMPIAKRQHGVYGEALDILVTECQSAARFAASLFGVTMPPSATVSVFDHRTLPETHDILAAAWRFRTNVAQARLPLSDKPLDSMTEWSNWLRDEVRDWQ